MVTISSARLGAPTTLICLKLTHQQVEDLEEELNDYNNNNPPIMTIEEYIVFLLEVMDREIG